MVVMLMMILTATFFFAMSSGSFAYVKGIEHSTQAKYLADAALSRLYSTVTATSPTGTSFTNQSLGAGTYGGSISAVSGGRYLATGTGAVSGITRTSTVELTPPPASALDYAITGGGNVTWTSSGGGGSNLVVGGVYTGGDASVNGTISGSVTAGGSITNGGTITGSQNANSSASVTFPTVDMAFYQAIASTNGYYYTSDRSYASGGVPAAPAGGVIYVDGNITFNGVQTTTACIVATGNITFQRVGGTQPFVTVNQFSNYPAIVANGNITYSCNGSSGKFDVNGLIYADGNIQLTQNQSDVDIDGVIVARGNVDTAFVSQSPVVVNYVPQSPPGLSTGSASLSIDSYNS